MAERRAFWQRRGVRIAAVIIAALLLFIGFLPTIIANTSLRNAVVNRALDDPELQATAETASFGWFSSTSVGTLDIERTDQKLHIGIDRVLIERSWLALFVSAPDIGPIEIDRPKFELRLPKPVGETDLDDLKLSKKRSDSESTFVATVHDAAVVIHAGDAKEPAVDLSGLDAKLHMIRNGDGRVLVMDPMVILNHQKLTPEFCNSGLHLVAPLLADSTAISGEVSLEIQQFHLPVGNRGDSTDENPLNISGLVSLHDVTSTFTNPLADEITKLVAGLIHREPPETIRVTDDCRVKVVIRRDGVYHEGFAFVFPQLSEKLEIRTSGTVTIDERLDLNLEIGLPSDLAAGIPVLDKLAQEPLKLVVRGTVDKPKVDLADGQDVLDSLSARLNGEEKPGPAKPVAASVIELVGGLAEEQPHGEDKPLDVERTTKDVLNLIRSIKKSADEKKKSSDKKPKKKKRKKQKRKKRRNKDALPNDESP